MTASFVDSFGFDYLPGVQLSPGNASTGVVLSMAGEWGKMCIVCALLDPCQPVNPPVAEGIPRGAAERL